MMVANHKNKSDTYKLLKLISTKLVLIFENDVMARFRSSLESLVGKKEEVKQPLTSDTAINNCARQWIACLTIRIFLLGWIEARVVPFAHSDDRDPGMFLLRPV